MADHSRSTSTRPDRPTVGRAKDLVRNVALYRLVPSIKEYWILGTRIDPDVPNGRWHAIHVGFGETCTTPVKLLLDPHK